MLNKTKIALILIILSFFFIKVDAQKNRTNIDSLLLYKEDSRKFVKEFRDLGGCQDNAQEPLNNHCYCTPDCFNVYRLFSPNNKQVATIYLIEIFKGVGRIGNEYWIVAQKSGQWIGLNYFTGYLISIKPKQNFNFDIYYKAETDHGFVKILLAPKGKYYGLKAIIDIEGNDVTKFNKKQLLEQQTQMPESSCIEVWYGK